MRCPRASCCCVARSRSEPNCAKAASSRYCARSRRSLPATCRMAFTWAEPPTRETESPTFTAARRAAQQQRELAIRGGVLAEVVVDAERVALAVAEVLAHRHAAIRRDVLQRRRFRGGRDDDGGERHGAGILEDLHHLGHRRALLADGDVEAEDVLALLVDDLVDDDGRLAGAAVADDQLALAAPDRDHRVDRLEAGLQRLLHPATVDHAGRVAL